MFVLFKVERGLIPYLSGVLHRRIYIVTKIYIFIVFIAALRHIPRNYPDKGREEQPLAAGDTKRIIVPPPSAAIVRLCVRSTGGR